MPDDDVRDVPGLDPCRLPRIGRALERFVADGSIPGWRVVVSRHGRVGYAASSGRRDAAGAPVTPDTLWRIYSMTKPVVSVAAMTLVEEGALRLDEPVAPYLPELADPRVYVSGSDLAPVTRPAAGPVRLWHLLTHTAGLSYAFHRSHPVDALLAAAGLAEGIAPGVDLATATSAVASVPLAFDPGTAWRYSHATDVLGRLLEVVTGEPLDTVLQERVLGPLGMGRTGFALPPGREGDLAGLHLLTPEGTVPVPRGDAAVLDGSLRPHGGDGLLSTADDYLRFAEFLRRRGELDGVRVLGPRTVDLMARNHLPGGGDLATVGTRDTYSETGWEGHGFGLGLGVVTDAARSRSVCSDGEVGWSGMAATSFWVDRDADLCVVLMAQVIGAREVPLRPVLHQTVLQAVL